MHCIIKASLAVGIFVVLGVAAPPARADTFTFTGMLNQNSPVQLFSFVVNNSSSVAISGTATFDLAVSLFGADGDLLNIGIDENGLTPFQAVVLDEFGNLILNSGTYFIAVTPLPLLPGQNLHEGFFFAFDDFGQQLSFADFGFTSGTFVLMISGPGVTRAELIPEPASLLLISTGLVGLVTSVRRRRVRLKGRGAKES